MAEVLRAEAKTAGNSQRVCRPRISTAAPQPEGSGAAAPAIFAYFPSLESRPPEAGPANNKAETNIEAAPEKEKAHSLRMSAPSRVKSPTKS